MLPKLFALVFVLLLSTAHAVENIEVIWPFGQGGTHDNMTRVVLQEANKLSTKYQFHMGYAPGAGGAVAMHGISNPPKRKIVANTGSFWLRPLLFKEARYDTQKFTPLAFYCMNNPLTIVSSKYTTFQELKNQRVSVGIIPGSITTLAAYVAFGKTDPGVTYVPYGGARQSTLDVMGKHLDVGIDFVAEVQNNALINKLAVTGRQPIDGVPTLFQLGVKDAEFVVNNNLLIASAEAFSADELADLRALLIKASLSTAVADNCTALKATPSVLDTPRKVEQQYLKDGQFWTRLTTQLGLVE